MSSEKDPPKQSPFESLNPAQREVGRRLLAEVSLDRLTVSYSIEERSPDGRKTSAFYSASASRKADATVLEEGIAGFSMDEALIVKTFLSKHVVQETYDDAFRRRVIPRTVVNVKERDEVLAAYDTKIAHLLSLVGSKKPEPSE